MTATLDHCLKSLVTLSKNARSGYRSKGNDSIIFTLASQRSVWGLVVSFQKKVEWSSHSLGAAAMPCRNASSAAPGAAQPCPAAPAETGTELLGAGATGKGPGRQPSTPGREVATSQPFWSVWQISPAPLLRGAAVTSHGCGPALHGPAATGAAAPTPARTYSHDGNFLGEPPTVPSAPFREGWPGACHPESGAASHPHPARTRVPGVTRAVPPPWSFSISPAPSAVCRSNCTGAAFFLASSRKEAGGLYHGADRL